jgi:hypothetical protein
MATMFEPAPVVREIVSHEGVGRVPVAFLRHADRARRRAIPRPSPSGHVESYRRQPVGRSNRQLRGAGEELARRIDLGRRRPP